MVRLREVLALDRLVKRTMVVDDLRKMSQAGILRPFAFKEALPRQTQRLDEHILISPFQKSAVGRSCHGEMKLMVGFVDGKLVARRCLAFEFEHRASDVVQMTFGSSCRRHPVGGARQQRKGLE